MVEGTLNVRLRKKIYSFNSSQTLKWPAFYPAHSEIILSDSFPGVSHPKNSTFLIKRLLIKQ